MLCVWDTSNNPSLQFVFQNFYSECRAERPRAHSYLGSMHTKASIRYFWVKFCLPNLIIAGQEKILLESD